MAASAEEMQTLYEEFAANFSHLSQRHEETLKDLEEARHERQKAEAVVAELKRASQAQATAVEDLRSELNGMQQYKERYYATCVAMEHLKGKLEAAWKARRERDEEHEAVVNQLKSQLQSVSGEAEGKHHAAQVQALRSQVAELEERCSVLSGHALTEKERVAQSSIAANSSLRDLQTRNASLEQQVHNLGSETNRLRSILRRSQDANTDLTKQLHDAEQEAKRLSDASHYKDAEMAALKSRMVADRKLCEETAVDERRTLTDKQDKLRAEVTALRAELTAKEGALAAMEAKLSRSEDAVRGKVLAVREEMRAELDALRTDKAEVTAELQSATRGLASKERLLHEAQVQLAAAERRSNDLEVQRGEMASLSDSLHQQISYLKGELAKRSQHVSQLQQQVASARETESQLHLKSVELDRMRMQLSFAEEGHAAATHEARAAADELRRFEKEATRRYKELFKKLKAAESDSSARRHHEGRRSHHHVAAQAQAPQEPGLPESHFDVLQVLRQQSEQAEGLGRVISALSAH